MEKRCCSQHLPASYLIWGAAQLSIPNNVRLQYVNKRIFIFYLILNFARFEFKENCLQIKSLIFQILVQKKIGYLKNNLFIVVWLFLAKVNI